MDKTAETQGWIKLTFSIYDYIIKVELQKKERHFREVGGSPAQVRYCKSQIPDAFFRKGIFCGNRKIFLYFAESKQRQRKGVCCQTDSFFLCYRKRASLLCPVYKGAVWAIVDWKIIM